MSKPTTPEAINETDYWNASAQVQELTAGKQPDDLYGRARMNFHDAMGVVDEAQRRALAGATTGKVILDRLIASGQLITPKKLEELSKFEAKLVMGEPALLRQGLDWKLGILDPEREASVIFSNVNRHSHFGLGPLANGYHALPVSGYVDMQIDPLAIYQPYNLGYQFGIKSVDQINSGPIAANVHMPLQATERNRIPRTHVAPDGLLTAWRNYSEMYGRRGGNGIRTFADSLLVGRGVVETGLGMTLENVLDHVSNAALHEYVTNHPAA